MHQAGLETVDEMDVLLRTGYARTDSTGYRKVMTALTKTAGHVTRSSGTLSLTAVGRAFIAQHGVAIQVTPPTMEEHQEKLLQSILDHAKAPQKAVRAIWNLLLDGVEHATADMLSAAGYQRTDSTGYREVMKWLKKLNLVEKKGNAVRATDKVYRYGARPGMA